MINIVDWLSASILQPMLQWINARTSACWCV